MKVLGYIQQILLSCRAHSPLECPQVEPLSFCPSCACARKQQSKNFLNFPMSVLSRNLPIIFHLPAHHLGFRTSAHSINNVNFLPVSRTHLPPFQASHALCGLFSFGDIPPRAAPLLLALTVSLNPRCVCASRSFFRSSRLTLSGHEPSKTSLILLNMGRTRPRYPLLAGKSRFFGVSGACSLLVVCVPVNLDKNSCHLNGSVPPVHSTATIDTSAKDIIGL